MVSFNKIAAKLASLEGNTHNISLSFAVGILIGFSPFWGFHTAMALSLCFLTRLNKPALMIGTFVNMPWIAVPYYAFATWLGEMIVRMRGLGVPPRIGLSFILSRQFLEWIVSQWRMLIPAFVGSLLLSAVLALISYWLVALFLARVRNGRDKSPQAGEARIRN